VPGFFGASFKPYPFFHLFRKSTVSLLFFAPFYGQNRSVFRHRQEDKVKTGPPPPFFFYKPSSFPFPRRFFPSAANCAYPSLATNRGPSALPFQYFPVKKGAADRHFATLFTPLSYPSLVTFHSPKSSLRDNPRRAGCSFLILSCLIYCCSSYVLSQNASTQPVRRSPPESSFDLSSLHDAN